MQHKKSLVFKCRINKQVIDPDGEALTSTWAYYQPGEPSGPGSSTKGLGRLKHHVRYDGYESFHTYGLHQTTIATPYANDPAGKTNTHTWDPTTKTHTSTTTVDGNVISKTLTTYGQNKLTRVVHTSAGETLTTTTHYKPIGEDFGGRPTRMLHADGTLTTYAYTRNLEGGFTTIIENGSTTNSSSVAQGLRTTTTVNSRGTTILRKSAAIGHGTGSAVFEHIAVTGIDFIGRATVTYHFPETSAPLGEIATAFSPAWATFTTYSCCGIATETDRHGILTYHAYDHLQRRIKTHRLGVTTETHHLGLSTETHRYPEIVSASLSPAFAGTSATLVSRSVRNLTGTLQESWSPDPTSATAGALIKSNSTATTYAPEPGLSRRTVTTTADNFSQTTASFLDGRTAATYGDLSPAMAYAYSANVTGEFTVQAYVVGTEHREVTATQSDWAGRTVATAHLPTFSSLITDHTALITYNYNALGQMEKSTDADGVTTLMAYNDKGERTTTALRLNTLSISNVIVYGTDSIQYTETVPAMRGSTPVWRTTNKVWKNGQTSASGGTIVSQSDRAATGLQSWTWQIGQGATPSDPNATFTTTVTTLQGNGNWSVTQTNPDGTYSVQTHTAGRLTSSSSLLTDHSALITQSYAYDTLNRPIETTDSRTGTTTTAYVSATADAVASVTDPGNRTTAFGYDIRGRQNKTILPDNTETTTTYTPRGEVSGRSGSQTYPVTYTYDYAGRMKSMTTTGNAGSIVTAWNYSISTGDLISKRYNSNLEGTTGTGPTYTHTPAGRFKTRTWASGKHTRYDYDSAGRLQHIRYFTAANQNTGSNPGNDATTPDVSATRDALGRILTVTRGGVLHGQYTYRESDLQFLSERQQIELLDKTVTYTYENGTNNTLAGRHNGYTFADGSASYTYGTTDGRLAAVSGGGLQPPSQFNYAYTANSNLIASVTGPAHTVTNTWEATRNVLKTKINATSSGAVSSFDYTVNAIGQRTAMRPALDGNNAPISTFSPSWDWSYNALGELVEADDQSGTNNRAYEYDAIGNRKKAIEGLAGDLAAAPVNYVANALNQYTTAEGVALPATPAPAPYDADGNMRFDGGVNQDDESREYVWDGENRLIAVKRVDGDVTLVSYVYDPFSRLIAMTVGTTTTRYIYSGWNRIAEYVQEGTGHVLKRSYLWGMDLSGTMQGAGGVGGLLAMTIHEAQSTTYYPTYDGNGNISEYISQTGAVAAHFEYDPFGGLTVDTENNAAQFPYRFSTKPQDLTTGLLYYGYRWYDPITGRWPSRDPIGEMGGINLYGFVGNNGIIKIDILGKNPCNVDDNPQFDNLHDRHGNCVSYAFNRMYGPYYPPGGPFGNCPDLIKALRSDPEFDFIDVPDNGCCPEGYHKIKIALDPGHDIHLWRQDNNRGWSHVQGTEEGGQAEQVLRPDGTPYHNPNDLPRDFTRSGGGNYSEDCGVFCARTNPSEQQRNLPSFRRRNYEGELGDLYAEQEHGLGTTDPERLQEIERRRQELRGRLRIEFPEDYE